MFLCTDESSPDVMETENDAVESVPTCPHKSEIAPSDLSIVTPPVLRIFSFLEVLKSSDEVVIGDVPAYTSHIFALRFIVPLWIAVPE